MRIALFTFLLSALTVFGQAPPYQRQFFTTNTDPVVRVTPGANVTVLFSQVGQTRTYQVAATPTAGTNYFLNLGILMGQTQGLYYTSIGQTNYFRSLVGGPAFGITLYTNGDNIILSNSSAGAVSYDANYTAPNVGTQGVFYLTSGGTNYFRSIVAYGQLQLYSNLDYIILSNSAPYVPTYDANQWPNVDGYTQGVWGVRLGQTNYFRPIMGGDSYGVMIYTQADGGILLSNSAPGGAMYAANMDVPIDGYTQGLYAVTIGNTNYFKMLVGGDSYGIKIYSNGSGQIIFSNLYPNIWWFTNPSGPVPYNAGVAAGTISNNYNVVIKGLLQLYGVDPATSLGSTNPFIEFRVGGSNYGNTFVGRGAGLENSTGNSNTFLGFAAGASNNIGYWNTLVGNSAGFKQNGIANENTAVGTAAMQSNTNMSQNTAIGSHALYNGLWGADNVAVGMNALYAAKRSYGNTAIGTRALAGLVDVATSEHGGNVAVGAGAMQQSLDGAYTVAVGSSCANQSDGSNNVFMGSSAAIYMSGVKNTIIGDNAFPNLATKWVNQSYNTMLGADSGKGMTNSAVTLVLGDRLGYYTEQFNNVQSNIIIGVGGVLRMNWNPTNDWRLIGSLGLQRNLWPTQSVWIGYPTMTPWTNIYTTNTWELIASNYPSTNIQFRLLVPSNVVVIATNPAYGSNVSTTVYGTTGDALINVPFYTASPSTSAPAGNEFVPAGWVRGLFSGGQLLYNCTNQQPYFTNMDFWYSALPTTNSVAQARTYNAVTNGQYLGTGISSTNRFTQVNSPMTVNAYLSFNTGGGRSVSVHPEFYYCYTEPGTNGPGSYTNLLGDYVAGAQSLIAGTNLYQWVISFPTITATNTSGFWVIRRFKVDSQANNPNVTIHGSGNTPSTIGFENPGITSSGMAQFDQNSVLTNVLMNGTYQSNTCGVATFDFSKPRQFTNTGTAITFSAVTGQDAVDVRTVALTITNNSGSPVLLTIPGTWNSPTNVYSVTNVGILSAESWGTYMTNAVFRSIK